MTLGQKIFELRKKNNLSQEQLGEKIDVTRQTISNWELDETSPNPDQLKKLSKVLNVSIDELLDNDIKNIVEEKISNTEKLAGIIIKILKFLGIGFIVLLVIDVIAFITFSTIRSHSVKSSLTANIKLECSIQENDYIVSVGSDGYFNCSNCSMEIQKELLDKYVDYGNLKETNKNIIKYFKNNNGICK